MELSQFDEYQEATTLDSIAMLARAILLDKVSIVNGRIVVDPFFND
jgi:hypothetical protein